MNDPPPSPDLRKFYREQALVLLVAGGCWLLCVAGVTLSDSRTLQTFLLLALFGAFWGHVGAGAVWIIFGEEHPLRRATVAALTALPAWVAFLGVEFVFPPPPFEEALFWALRSAAMLFAAMCLVLGIGGWLSGWTWRRSSASQPTTQFALRDLLAFTAVFAVLLSLGMCGFRTERVFLQGPPGVFWIQAKMVLFVAMIQAGVLAALLSPRPTAGFVAAIGATVLLAYLQSSSDDLMGVVLVLIIHTVMIAALAVHLLVARRAGYRWERRR